MLGYCGGVVNNDLRRVGELVNSVKKHRIAQAVTHSAVHAVESDTTENKYCKKNSLLHVTCGLFGKIQLNGANNE